MQTIPLDHPLVQRARELIPERYWDNTWVAGSAATRFGQHEDVDVWIAEVPRDLDPWQILPRNEGTRPPPVVDAEEEYSNICLKVYNNADEKLQIMASWDTMQHMLDKFDIACHAGAVNIVTGKLRLSMNYRDRVGVAVCSENMPELTLYRYLKFARRYRDWSGLYDPMLLMCAANTFGLYTQKDLEREAKYLYIDRGL